MNDFLAALVDAGTFDWGPLASFASSALALFASGVLLFIVQRRADAETRRRTEERATIKSELTALNLKHEAEREERRRDFEREADLRRRDDAALGRDIGEIREEINYDYGKRGQERPVWRQSKPN